MPWIELHNWKVYYERSASSGVRLRTCDYQGTRVVYGASVPFVYVQYQGTGIGPFTDELRSSTDEIEIRDIMNGFDIRARYDLYGEDYQYEHIWRFHNDGQFGSAIVIHGPGEEILGRHTYYIPFRFDLDLSGASGDSFQVRRPTGQWDDLAQEGVSLPLTPWAPGYDWRLVDKASGKAARIRARAGDNAQLWTLRYSEIESWSSWGGVQTSAPGTTGSVPAIYVTGQSVQDTDIVLWYIARVPSVDRIMVCGPWFALDGFPPPREEHEEHLHGDHEREASEHAEHEGHPHEMGMRLAFQYLGRAIEIEVMHDEEHGGHAAGAEQLYTVRIDGREIMAHRLGANDYHTHELPFVKFSSLEALAAALVNHLEYGTYHGRPKKSK
jgi:hypothetical protein